MTDKPKTYFIALDTETYTLDKSVIPINLDWNMSLTEMLETTRNGLKDVKDEDIVIGHSLGATMAILSCPKGTLQLYSVSPCFKEAKHLLGEEHIKELGSKYNELDNFSIKDVKLKPTCYIGEKEMKMMYKTLTEVKKLSGIKSYIIKGADHGDVINHSGKIKYGKTKV